MLTGPEIVRQRQLGNIVIDPFDEARVNPNSYNLRLSNHLKVYSKAYKRHRLLDEEHEYRQHWPTDTKLSGLLSPRAEQCVVEPLDMAVEEETEDIFIPDAGLVLWPGVLYLGSTIEYTETKNFVPVIEGRSSVGRLGMCIHLTAGFGDCGFSGNWTLEITVVHPLAVYAEVEICQIAYSPVEGETKPYRGKYSGQQGPKPSGLWKELGHKRKKE